MASELERRLRIQAEMSLTNQDALAKQLAEIAVAAKNAAFNDAALDEIVNNLERKIKETVSDTGKFQGDARSDDSKKTEKEAKDKVITGAVQGLEGMANSGVEILQSTFSIITTIYERLKASSPLLQTIESLFNLAVQLFFMPLGTKLATEMLPAVLTLVDDVMQIWDFFGEETSLGDLLAKTIELGAEIFGRFFINLGDQLADEGGLLGAIGGMLQFMGHFIQDKGEQLLDLIITVTSWIISNLPAILATIVGLLIASKALQIVQITATIASAVAAGSNTPWGAIGTAAAIGTVATVASAAGVYGYLDGAMAEGGYVPATPGGGLYLLGEGGEGETVVPDSKKKAFAENVLNGYSPGIDAKFGSKRETATSNVFNIYVNGYTDTNLEDKIVRVINERTNLSRLRSGF